MVRPFLLLGLVVLAVALFVPGSAWLGAAAPTGPDEPGRTSETLLPLASPAQRSLAGARSEALREPVSRRDARVPTGDGPLAVLLTAGVLALLAAAGRVASGKPRRWTAGPILAVGARSPPLQVA